jgi:hypothetical protein
MIFGKWDERFAARADATPRPVNVSPTVVPVPAEKKATAMAAERPLE